MAASYWVQQRPDGKWEVKNDETGESVAVTQTQNEAWGQATHLARQSKGWAFLRDRSGKVRQQKPFGSKQL